MFVVKTHGLTEPDGVRPETAYHYNLTINMNRILLLLISSLISACAATGPIYKPAENVDANKALVYVYRGPAFALGARSAYFYVDGVNVFDLDQGGYSWVALSPGRHTLRQKWPVDVTMKAVEFEIDVRAGETRYFSFQTGGCQGGYNQICLQWELRAQPPQVGAVAIIDKRFQENVGAAKLNMQAPVK